MKKMQRKAAGGLDTIEAANQKKLVNYATILKSVVGNDCVTQRARLTAALKITPVTTYEARKFLDIYDSPARILELRKLGWQIDTQRVHQKTDAGVIHKRIGKYVLTGGAPC